MPSRISFFLTKILDFANKNIIFFAPRVLNFAKNIINAHICILKIIVTILFQMDKGLMLVTSPLGA